MPRYYTRVCNFYYGANSKRLLKEKKSLPLNGNKEISFDRIQIISRKFQKEISIHNINNLPKSHIEDIIHRAEKFHASSRITKYQGKKFNY